MCKRGKLTSRETSGAAMTLDAGVAAVPAEFATDDGPGSSSLDP